MVVLVTAGVQSEGGDVSLLWSQYVVVVIRGPAAQQATAFFTKCVRDRLSLRAAGFLIDCRGSGGQL